MSFGFLCSEQPVRAPHPHPQAVQLSCNLAKAVRVLMK